MAATKLKAEPNKRSALASVGSGRTLAEMAERARREGCYPAQITLEKFILFVQFGG